MKSIRVKIRTLLLMVSLLALALMCIVTVVSIWEIRSDVISASNNLGTSAGENSAAVLEEQILERLSSTAETKAGIADEKLGKQQIYTQTIADYAGKIYSDPTSFKAKTVNPPDPKLAGTVTAQLLLAEGVDASAISTEAGAAANCINLMMLIPQNDSDITADYIATESGFVIMVDADSNKKPSYVDGRERGWYKSAKESDKLIWTDVFNDSMGRGLAITCAAPVHDAQGNVTAVVGIGALMTNLNEEIINTKIGETGYMFVVNQAGNIIISPKIQKSDDGTAITENILNSENPQIAELIKNMLAGKSGVAQVEYNGRKVYMACEPMKTLPWGVVSIIDVEEALDPVTEIQGSIHELTDTSISAIDHSIKNAFIAVLAVVLVVLLSVFIVSGYFTKRLTNPLARLTAGVEEISGGMLDTKLDIHTGDEIEILSESFNSMTSNLKQYITDLTSVTAEKERIGAELNVATQIQASMLPCIFPPFPEHEEFDIYANMQPAKEVGGDFYDFFLVDDNHLGLVMADVSDKGVPAALFMVIAKTLIKNHAQNGESPAQVLTAVNSQLCENNDAAMFVTAWVGILDIRDGTLTYSNAGHNPPLLKRNGESSFTYLKSDPGFVLAGLESMKYKQFETTLKKGDILFLYTDGVTEATNKDEELFGEERLKAVLDEYANSEMYSLLPAVKLAMNRFVDGADQFDDITMLGLKYKGYIPKIYEVPHITNLD